MLCKKSKLSEQKLNTKYDNCWSLCYEIWMADVCKFWSSSYKPTQGSIVLWPPIRKHDQVHTGVHRRNLHLLFFRPGLRACPELDLNVLVLLLKVAEWLSVLLLLLTLLDKVFISYLVFWLRRELSFGLTAGSWLYTSLRCGRENMV